MSTRIPPSLKWLVNKRARLANEIARSQRDAGDRALDLAVLEAKTSMLREDLASIDRALSMHEVLIRPESIAPIQTPRFGRLFSYNHMTRVILAYLRSRRSAWCSTTEIVAVVIRADDQSQAAEHHPSMRLAVRRRLRALRAAGRIAGRHVAKSNLEGYWSLPQSGLGRPAT